MEGIRTLTKAQRKAAANMGDTEVRYLVDLYYQIQELRKATSNQTRAQVTSQEPFSFHLWVAEQFMTLEKQMKSVLDAYTAADPLGREVRKVVGLGPVTTAGLLAHIDINKAKTAGAIWRFAGLDPTAKWEKGQKRPWNADLKVLCYKIGESFVKTQNSENSEYGKLFRQKRDELQKLNDDGAFAEDAANILKAKKFNKSTIAYQAYSQGKLPDAHLHARARRYVVKLFLADYHKAAYHILLGEEPPVPYIIAHDPQHTHVHWGTWVPAMRSNWSAVSKPSQKIEQAQRANQV